MDPSSQLERRLRDAIEGIAPESGLRYEVLRNEDELVLKLVVSEQVTKQRLWELWRGDWPSWNEIAFRVPHLKVTEIEWDGTCFMRRFPREFFP
jgi:hypothetical protein